MNTVVVRDGQLIGYNTDGLGLVADLQMSTHVKFHGAVEHIKLPDILNRYRVFLNFADTALDRAVVEAMACGLPVASSNQCVAEILTTDLQRRLMIPHDDAHAQAERIHQLLSLNPEERTSLGETLRDLVLSNHSIESLVDTILGEMTQGHGKVRRKVIIANK